MSWQALALMRIDKFLWCVRLYKSRSLATEACASGHVRMGDREVKASAVIQVRDLFSVRQAPIWRSFEVIALPSTRVGAKLVPGLITDRTSWEDLEKQETARKVKAAQRDPGSGRPTKRERRKIDRFTRDD
ncbi:MAG: RNA-binding S4 domain-containing protein [Bacteroidetes bacterium]|jgi:ribosome-associated heat shock protein Hsp15|nr:RNA-binding S4 domain-containing protein [Bacteroidota bacterium]MBX7130806.1 RNA-binding S4 domain-containing protein [Flavobacteriales bacterium]MCC6656215.1 RNA-binding S4 domain-containing protein [Flavobacteriales bacterium]HMU14290.1 RNA-binding S4 domain-containing protein [Flavobacteriales bacterium]HMW97246.1 RNA-binding S4 domain-containing protein [Flavobacteriales bacterium]